jgi:selenocysteine lyase/cysteine desulfurase
MTRPNAFPVHELRAEFPALSRHPDVVFLENAGGAQVAERAPTFCFSLAKTTPQAFAAAMGREGVALRDGHMFAPRLMARLGLAFERGAIRVSLAHYNTVEDIARFEDAAHRVLAKL